MAAVCDASAGPDSSPSAILNGSGDYEFTRRFLIYATAVTDSVTHLINSLAVRIQPYGEPDARGTPKTTSTWETLRDEFLQLPVPPLPPTTPHLFSASPTALGEPSYLMRDRTPLDFAVYGKTCIILRLVGKFWTFRYDFPVTTKRNLAGHFRNLTRYASNRTPSIPAPTSDFDCVALFCDTPCDDGLNVRHGLNLNCELILTSNGNEERLPIIIDPDVENRGGNSFYLYQPAEIQVA